MLEKITGLLFILIGLGVIIAGLLVGRFLMLILGNIAGIIFGGVTVLFGCWLCKFGYIVAKR